MNKIKKILVEFFCISSSFFFPSRLLFNEVDLTNLYDFLNKPPAWLQFSLCDMLYQGLLKMAVVCLWKIHSREQVRDDSLEQGNVMWQKLQYKYNIALL